LSIGPRHKVQTRVIQFRWRFVTTLPSPVVRHGWTTGTGGVAYFAVPCKTARPSFVYFGHSAGTDDEGMPPHLRGLQFGTKPARGMVETDRQVLAIPGQRMPEGNNVQRNWGR
jgi:hypothetical protein